MKNTLDEWIALHEQEFIQDITAVRRAERNAFGHWRKCWSWERIMDWKQK